MVQTINGMEVHIKEILFLSRIAFHSFTHLSIWGVFIY